MLSILTASFLKTFEMLCVIWYHLYNLKREKHNGGVLKPETLPKVAFLHVFHV